MLKGAQGAPGGERCKYGAPMFYPGTEVFKFVPHLIPYCCLKKKKCGLRGHLKVA